MALIDIILGVLELLFTALLIYLISLSEEYASLIAISGIAIVLFGSVLMIIYQKKHGKKI